MRETTFVAVRDSLGGPNVCGALRPFNVAAAAQGSVQLRAEGGQFMNGLERLLPGSRSVLPRQRCDQLREQADLPVRGPAPERYSVDAFPEIDGGVFVG